MNRMIHIALVLIFVFSLGCSEDRKFEDFVNADKGKGEQEFRQDSQKCTANKDKFSHKIRGRELGFEGEHAGYLGCMQLQGWARRVAGGNMQ